MIELSGFATLRADIKRVKDLRDLVKWLDSFAISDRVEVDTDCASVWIPIADTNDGGRVTMIECGEHMTGDEKWDVLFETHAHGYDLDEGYEDYDVKPGWDWVRNLVLPDSDKYSDEARPE